MEKLLSLGELYVSDFVQEQPADRKKYSLDLYLDRSTNTVRLHPDNLVPRDELQHGRWHRSSHNPRIQYEFKSLVDDINSKFSILDGDIWLDIGCNDGSLLDNVPDTATRIGFDPYAATQNKHTVVQDYFNREKFFKVSNKKANIITCIDTFACIADPNIFIEDMIECLDDEGIIVLEMSYSPGITAQLAFDVICHENFYYYDMNSIGEMFHKQGFRIVDASFNDNNGGSFRVYLRKTSSNFRNFGNTQLMRNVCDLRVMTMLTFEDRCNINGPEFWKDLIRDLQEIKHRLKEFIGKARNEGKTIYGYGATTRGNTFLQYFDLGKEDLSALVDYTGEKIGLRTIGTDIPIIDRQQMLDNPPDYLLVLPWYLIDEVITQEEDFLKTGGKLVVTLPIFDVIGSSENEKNNVL